MEELLGRRLRHQRRYPRSWTASTSLKSNAASPNDDVVEADVVDEDDVVDEIDTYDAGAVAEMNRRCD